MLTALGLVANIVARPVERERLSRSDRRCRKNALAPARPTIQT